MIKMALSYSKCLLLSICNKNGCKYFFPILATNVQFCTESVIHSKEFAPSQRASKAMKAYLERARKYDQFLKEQADEFELGKKHLANIMGKRGADMTQKEIDEAIGYLFPSKLFDKIARPMLKSPEELFAKRKEAEFDINGRPHHYLFYTTVPNFSQLLHNAAKTLEELNLYELNMRKAKANPPTQTLIFAAQCFLSKEALEKKLLEKLYDIDYEKFVEVFEKLKNHPYNYIAENFIKSYIVSEGFVTKRAVAKAVANSDGSISYSARSKRKTALANVTVTYPGTGKVKINDKGIDYFTNMESREQEVNSLLKRQSATNPGFITWKNQLIGQSIRSYFMYHEFKEVLKLKFQ